jgi:hypothetical protein
MNTKTTPKDFFLYLGATIALYASAVALINLAFETINRALPDTLAGYYSANSIVWPISMLIVLVPVFYVLEWLITRDIAKISEKKDMWIRKWRIYLTLFLTGATIVGDLITLINTFLNGEITSRFILKVLIVMVISAIIFAYYILQKISDSISVGKWKKILAWLGIVCVLAGIVGGFIIVGSPAKQRAIRFDQMRIDNLSNIQFSVAHYWQEFGKVPKTLKDMSEYMNNVPMDPQTEIPYRYEAGLTTNSFTLCATFLTETESLDQNYPKPYSSYGSNTFYDWSHGIGEKCFDRTVSTVDFPPIISKPVR